MNRYRVVVAYLQGNMNSFVTAEVDAELDWEIDAEEVLEQQGVDNWDDILNSSTELIGPSPPPDLREIYQTLADLIEWDTKVGPHEALIWRTARRVRERMRPMVEPPPLVK